MKTHFIATISAKLRTDKPKTTRRGVTFFLCQFEKFVDTNESINDAKRFRKKVPYDKPTIDVNM